MRGIPFCTVMIKALLNTRINEQPAWPIDPTKPFKRHTRRVAKVQCVTREKTMRQSPARYEVGRVYVVREGLRRGRVSNRAYYQAGGLVSPDNPFRWSWENDRLPSIFMPDIAGRLYVKIVQADLVRLKEMTGMDCVFEGLLVTHDEMDRQYGEDRWGAKEEEHKYLYKFARLIDDLNGRDTWAKNPWAWMYELMRVDAYE